MHCLRSLREIKLLRHFRHENIISILDILQLPSLRVVQGRLSRAGAHGDRPPPRHPHTETE
jgi:hypothetical protein